MIHTMPHRFIVNDNSKILLREGIDISVIQGAVKKNEGGGSFRVLRRNDKTELLVTMKFIKSKLYLTQLLGRSIRILCK